LSARAGQRSYVEHNDLEQIKYAGNACCSRAAGNGWSERGTPQRFVGAKASGEQESRLRERDSINVWACLHPHSAVRNVQVMGILVALGIHSLYGPCETFMRVLRSAGGLKRVCSERRPDHMVLFPTFSIGAAAASREVVQPAPRPLADAQAQALEALVTRRRQLVEMLTAEKNRRTSAPKLIYRSIDEHIRWLEKRLAEMETNWAL